MTGLIASDNETLPADHPLANGARGRLADSILAQAVLPRRAFGAHKWGVGGLLIIAGSPGFSGAAALCAMAAGRAGAGIINVAIPHGAAGAVTTAVPEAAIVLLPAGDVSGTARRAADLIKAKMTRSKAIVVGPGLGDDEAAEALLAALFGSPAAQQVIGFGSRRDGTGEGGAAPSGLLSMNDLPLVIDADGLNWLAKQPEWWGLVPERRAVLTPHPAEMARLLGQDIDQVLADPVQTVRAAAKQWKQTVVLKYGYTAASDGDDVIFAPSAPRSLATAGSGDVFAGMIGAFLAQGVSPLDAAALAIYIGGQAAGRVGREVGTLGTIASDLPLAIAQELASLEVIVGDQDG